MNGIRAFVMLLAVIGGASFKPDYQTEDIFIPSECESIASTGDHLLIDYTVYFSNGTVCSALPKASQLLHVMLTTQVRHHFYFLLYSLINIKFRMIYLSSTP